MKYIQFYSPYMMVEKNNQSNAILEVNMSLALLVTASPLIYSSPGAPR